MKQDDKTVIEEIINELVCPKNIKCNKTKLNDLCRAEDIGLESFILCLTKNPKECTCSFSFGGSYFCNCPPRVYISKKFQK